MSKKTCPLSYSEDTNCLYVTLRIFIIKQRQDIFIVLGDPEVTASASPSIIPSLTLMATWTQFALRFDYWIILPVCILYRMSKLGCTIKYVDLENLTILLDHSVLMELITWKYTLLVFYPIFDAMLIVS